MTTINVAYATDIADLVAQMNEHARELEERGERHVYGPAIQRLVLLRELAVDLNHELKEMN